MRRGDVVQVPIFVDEILVGSIVGDTLGTQDVVEILVLTASANVTEKETFPCLQRW